jgi:uncharacterized protein (TIGR00369 family)
MNDDHYRRLERLYHRAPCNRALSPAISISDGRAEVRIPIGQHMFHPLEAVHGAFYFKALDDAAFFAANSVVEDVFVMTASFNVQLLRPVTEGVLVAEGRLVKDGKQLLFADSVLRDLAGNELATGSGVFVRSRHALP